jgi:hypothetical protein
MAQYSATHSLALDSPHPELPNVGSHPALSRVTLLRRRVINSHREPQPNLNSRAKWSRGRPSVVSDVVGVYNEDITDVRARGPHDPALKRSQEGSVFFSGSPKDVTEILVAAVPGCCGDWGATPVAGRPPGTLVQIVFKWADEKLLAFYN